MYKFILLLLCLYSKNIIAQCDSSVCSKPYRIATPLYETIHSIKECIVSNNSVIIPFLLFKDSTYFFAVDNEKQIKIELFTNKDSLVISNYLPNNKKVPIIATKCNKTDIYYLKFTSKSISITNAKFGIVTKKIAINLKISYSLMFSNKKDRDILLKNRTNIVIRNNEIIYSKNNMELQIVIEKIRNYFGI